ncbi:MAG: hypothetical protein PWQ82_164 [Thermosediminibacterales bacterium]|nr:hypothetical protein [Thermosediminibacterales bacterium]MDK2835329.1 hypothetical protein [Thermosediminibacterales bacterium]
METLCPLCNGLINAEERCPNCGYVMEDYGAIETFYDPYRPYVEFTIENHYVRPNTCTHLLACPRCGWDKRVYINKKTI